MPALRVRRSFLHQHLCSAAWRVHGGESLLAALQAQLMLTEAWLARDLSNDSY